MNVTNSKTRGKALKDIISGILSADAFPFFTAAVVLACYYLGWDLVTIYYLAATGILMLLFLDDLTPLVSPLTFLHILVSMKNTPTHVYDNSNVFYMQPYVLAQIFGVVGLYVAAIIARLFFMGRDRYFKPTPVFWGLCAFSGALILNGAFTKGYDFNNLLFGAVLAFFFLGVYVLISCNVRADKRNYVKLAWGFVAFSLALAVEVAAKYIANGADMFDGNGEIIKNMLVFGWGIWNTMGMLLVISIPIVMVIASYYKHGYLIIFYAAVLAVAAVCTTSRQAMLAVAVVFPASLVAACVKGKNRKAAIALTSVLVLAGVAVLIFKWKTVWRLFNNVKDNLFNAEGEFTGNGRTTLIQDALGYFFGAPVFGQGFHVNYGNDPGFVGLDFIPLMAHNTFAELLAACGLVGFIAYIVHRVQTVIFFAHKPNVNKVYVALSIFALLLMCLFDNHIFYIFPTIIYSAILPFALGQTSEGRALLNRKPRYGLSAECTIMGS